MSAADVFAEARAKLDGKIAEAARDLVEAIESEADKRGEVEGVKLVSIVLPRPALEALRARIGAWEALEQTIGECS